MKQPMPAAPVSDADLVERSRRRDAAAFGSLVERHQQLVFGVALARCGDPALAEDVAQDAFVLAWRDLDRLRDADRVGSWVAGIARNLASNAARDRARRRTDEPAAEPAAERTPEDEALGREDRELLQRALADVPAAHREALVLYYLDGESIARIAASLGIREDLVKQRLSRGRRALRDAVARRVEAALARVRPGRGFGAGVIAAVSALAARKAVAANATGKVILVAGSHKAGLGLAALAVAIGATWWAIRARDRRPDAPAAVPAAIASPASPNAAPADPPDPTSPHVRRLRDAAERTALVEQIRAARARRAEAGPRPAVTPPSAASSSSPAPALPEPVADRAYIRRAVHELLPLLTDCYQQGLARDPALAGTVVVDFTIEGEPGVGGVIGHSAIDPAETSLADDAARECIQETMYALQIDPPADGGVVTVRYPFEFHP
jgi:RNA polymerase sigma factor (sigma-70 family)